MEHWNTQNYTKGSFLCERNIRNYHLQRAKYLTPNKIYGDNSKKKYQEKRKEKTTKIVAKTSVNSGDCRSDFHHHSPKTYDSALAGSNSTTTRSNPLVRRWTTGPSFEKSLFLRCVAQGADHEVSADWIAASSGDIKTQDLAASLSSLLLLGLSCRTSCQSSTSTCLVWRVSRVKILHSSSCLQYCYSTFLWVHSAACYEAPFLIYPAACHQCQLFIIWRLPVPILILIKYLLPPL